MPATSLSGLFIQYKPVNVTRQGRVSLVLPPVSYAGVNWLGSSYIIAEFPLVASYNFSIPLEIESSEDYVLAVSWIDSDTGKVVRYLFWSGVGEVLNYPTYVSERIPSYGCKFEVWTVNNDSTTVVFPGLTIYTSLLLDRITPYDNPSSSASVAQDPYIWDVLPMPLPTTFPLARS